MSVTREEIGRILTLANNQIGSLDPEEFEELYDMVDRAREFFGLGIVEGPTF